MSWEELTLGYGDQIGSLALREEVKAAFFTSPEVTPSSINICAPSEGIFLAVHAVLLAATAPAPAGPPILSKEDLEEEALFESMFGKKASSFASSDDGGDEAEVSDVYLSANQAPAHVVSCMPCYQSLYEVAKNLNAEITPWYPRTSENSGGSFLFDVADFLQLIREDTKLVILNFPHNPTGATLSPGDFHRVVVACKAVGAYLLNDEMYRSLEHPPLAPLPTAADSYEKGISLGGVSKSLALPGLRIGWLASQVS